MSHTKARQHSDLLLRRPLLAGVAARDALDARLTGPYRLAGVIAILDTALPTEKAQ